ncbi:MAG: hypothetical protein U1F11_00285 [Steroidobacteraceae bacterium]
MANLFDRLFGAGKGAGKNPTGRNAASKTPAAGARTAGAPQRGADDATRRPVAPRGGGFAAVAITPCNQACAAARERQNDKLLARSAPTLPLKDCDRPQQCSCKFRKFDDRRAGPQRSVYHSDLVKHYPGDERRKRRGRRSAD